MQKKLYKIAQYGDSFLDDFEKRFCWSNNALEGNTLSLIETVNLLDYDEVQSGHTYSEYQEAKNVYAAIKKYADPDGASKD